MQRQVYSKECPLRCTKLLFDVILAYFGHHRSWVLLEVLKSWMKSLEAFVHFEWQVNSVPNTFLEPLRPCKQRFSLGD